MKLSKAQLEYAARRIRTVINEKANAELASIAQCPTMTPERSTEELWKLVFDGKAKPCRSDIFTDNYISLRNFEFPENKEQKAYEKALKNYEAKKKTVVSKWEKVQQQALDKLHLAGDAEAALALINSL